MARHALFAGGVAAALVFAACSDSSSGGATDQGDSGGDLGTVGSQLTPPEPPRLTPCPDGWVETPAEDETTPAYCLPWADGADLACDGVDQAHFVGEVACATVGTPCGAGDWATDLPEAGTLRFVLASAAEGGDGTRQAPYRTLAEALADAQEGDVIALGKGSYDESLTLPTGVTLWGACTAETVLAVSDATTESPAIDVTGSSAALRNLRLDVNGPAVRLGAGAELAVEGVVVDGAEQYAFSVDGGTLTAHDLSIRNVDVDPDNPRLGAGVQVLDGLAEVRRVRVEAVTGVGLGAIGATSQFVVEDAIVTHVKPIVGNEGIPFSVGIWVVDGAGTATRTLVECSSFTNISVAEDPGTSFSATDLVVRGGATGEDCSLGGGIIVLTGSLDLERALFMGNRGLTVDLEEGVDARLTDVWVRDTLPNPEDHFGVGLWALEASSLTLSRVQVDDSTGASVGVYDASQVDGTDVRIQGTDALSCEAGNECPEGILFGSGLIVSARASARLERFEVVDSDLAGLQIHSDGELDLVDGLVARNAIGVNLQNPDYDLSRLEQRVVYRDNQRNLDTERLPLPNPAVIFDH